MCGLRMHSSNAACHFCKLYKGQALEVCLLDGNDDDDDDDDVLPVFLTIG